MGYYTTQKICLKDCMFGCSIERKSRFLTSMSETRQQLHSLHLFHVGYHISVFVL